MADWTGFLARDTQQDDGTVPSTGEPYRSPDVIPQQQQTTDPVATYSSASSYASNPGQSIEGGVYNYFYLRAKNLGDAPATATCHAYWSDASLLLWPSQWRNNGLSTAAGDSSQILSDVPANAIAVTPVPFVWVPGQTNSHFCMIARWPSAGHPADIPEGQLSVGEFVTWVRTHPNICYRNLTLVNNYPDPEYADLAVVQNDSSDDVLVTFKSTCVNLPNGTVVRQTCAPLGIDESQTISGSPQYVLSSGMMPGDFDGALQVTATLPSGAPWPNDAAIETTAYVGVDARTRSDEAALLRPHAEDWGVHGIAPHDVGLATGGFLVEVGNVTTAFQAG